MNKKTLYVAILLAALTACQKAEYTAPATLSDEPIRFGAPGIALDGGLLSRAAGPVNEFPEGGSFGVLGYCLAMKGDNTDLDYSTGPDPWNSKAPRLRPQDRGRARDQGAARIPFRTGRQIPASAAGRRRPFLSRIPERQRNFHAAHRQRRIRRQCVCVPSHRIRSGERRTRNVRKSDRGRIPGKNTRRNRFRGIPLRTDLIQNALGTARLGHAYGGQVE